MKVLCSILLLTICSCVTRADTIQQVTQEIKVGSALTLKQGVAQTWAGNLLGAQSCAYCGPESLGLSVDAILKAISLEGSIAGFSWCGLANCTWANQQSLIAIDPNAGVTITPLTVNFGLVAVTTPEPTIWLLALAGLVALGAAQLFMLGGRGPKNI